MRPGNIARGLLATVLLAGAALAQEQPKPDPQKSKEKSQPVLPDLPPIPEFKPNGPKPAPAPQAAAVPDAEASLAAFLAVQGWVKAWSTDAAGALESPKVSGASVTIRYLGEPVGRGVDTTGDETTIARATRAALREAGARIPVPDDALREQRLRELSSQFMISLELAGPLVPIREKTFDDIDLALSPGLDGVAVRLDKSLEMAFPGAMLATRSTPGDSAAALSGRVLGDPSKALRVDPTAQPFTLRERYGLVISRFRAVHLAQTAPGKPPIFLHRGQRVVETREITTAALKEMSEGIAGHLIARIGGTPDKPELRGPYDPTQGRWEPAVAGMTERGLVAYALGSRGARELILSHVARDAAKPDAFSEPGSAAAVWLAGAFPPQHEVRLKAKDARKDSNPPLSIRSLNIVGEILEELDVPRSGATPAIWLKELVTQTSESELASGLPWIAIAYRFSSPFLGERSEPEPVAVKLRKMRELIYQNVLTADDAGEDGRDMIGGIVFPGSRQPLPTAQTARIVAGLAEMLQDEKLTPTAEFQAELVRLLPCLRFLRQLCADESESWMYRDAAVAKWGVRSAVWDQRMPGEASALTLMAVDSTLNAMNQQRGKK